MELVFRMIHVLCHQQRNIGRSHPGSENGDCDVVAQDLAWLTCRVSLGGSSRRATGESDESGVRVLGSLAWFARLDPTNPASVFVLTIHNVPGQSDRKNLTFSPGWPDRTYTLIHQTNWVDGAAWSNVNGTDNHHSGKGAAPQKAGLPNGPFMGLFH